MKTLIIGSCAVLASQFIMVACEKQEDPYLSEDPNLLSTLYTSASDTLQIETQKFFLSAYLYRDFMPTIPIKQKNPLVAVIRLVGLDSTKIPLNLDMTKLYVIKGDIIWISDPKDINDTNSDYKVEKVSNNGPEWDTGIYVDIVVEISNPKTSNKSLLILKHQIIDRTE